MIRLFEVGTLDEDLDRLACARPGGRFSIHFHATVVMAGVSSLGVRVDNAMPHMPNHHPQMILWTQLPAAEVGWPQTLQAVNCRADLVDLNVTQPHLLLLAVRCARQLLWSLGCVSPGRQCLQ